MELNNLYGTIIGMYIAKYNSKALENLGYKTFNEAFADISEKVGLNGAYLKLSRDEFDPFYGWRKGFWKRDVAKRCLLVMDYFDDLSEENFREIILGLINSNKNIIASDAILSLVASFKEPKILQDSLIYSTRGITGEKAERYFIDNFTKIETFSGSDYKDCRLLGCGYDFEVTAEDDCKYYIEVKGVTSNNKGLLFTDKEWQTAKRIGKNYIVFVVNFSDDKVEHICINDPYKTLEAKKNLYTSVQVNWITSIKDI